MPEYEDRSDKRRGEVEREHSIWLFQTVIRQYQLAPDIPKSTKIEEIEMLPTRERYMPLKHLLSNVKRGEDTALPKVPINEIIGLPESGKSELVKYLSHIYPNAVVRDESVYPNTENTPSDVDYLFFLPEKKLIASIPAIEVLIEEKINNPDDSRTIDQASVITRGPNDVIALLYRYFHGLSKGLFFTYDPEDEFDLTEHAMGLLYDALLDLIHIDSVILFYNDLGTAKQRRATTKKTKISRMVNKEVWPIVEESYQWWLQRIYPILRETYGTGLLVVDGRKGLKENNERVHRYIDSIIQHIPRRDV